MDTVKIVAQRRSETGKGPARRLRMAGKLPVVLYGRGDSAALTIETKDLQVLRQSESGSNTIIDLSIEGGEPETCNAILREVQVDPVSRAMLHADFGRVALDELITVSVPLEFVNVPNDRLKMERSELNIVLYELSIECLPRAIPNAIAVDLGAIGIGEAWHAGDVALPEGVSLAGNTDDTIVTTSTPSAVEAEAEGEAEAETGGDTGEAVEAAPEEG